MYKIILKLLAVTCFIAFFGHTADSRNSTVIPSYAYPRLSNTTINNILAIRNVIDKTREIEQKHKEQIKNDQNIQSTIKIVSLAPNVTENLYYLGLMENIVGIDALSDFPKKIQNLPKVATMGNIDYEEILKLNPDLIVVWNDFFPDLEKDLKRYKIKAKVFRFITHRLSEFGDAILKLGRITHTENRAVEIREMFYSNIKEIKNKYQNYPTHSVAYIIWDDPIYTVSHNSWINDIIEICNGKNPFVNYEMDYPAIEKENLLSTNPEVIINATVMHSMLNFPTSLHGRIVTLTKVNNIHRLSKRTIDGITEICELIHGNDLLVDESEPKEIEDLTVTDPNNVQQP